MWGTHTDWPCNDWLGDFFDFSQIKFLWGKKKSTSVVFVCCPLCMFLLTAVSYRLSCHRKQKEHRPPVCLPVSPAEVHFWRIKELKTVVGCQVYGFLLGVGLAQQMLVIPKDVTSRSYLLFPLFHSILPNHLPSIRRGLETANLFHTWLVVK